jgi:phosphocarrier protein FPr
MQSTDDWHEMVVTVRQPEGIHLRAGKDVVTLAAGYEAELEARNLSRPSPTVSLKSILALMQLQAREGHELLLRAHGADAPAALEAMRQLLDAPGI